MSSPTLAQLGIAAVLTFVLGALGTWILNKWFDKAADWVKGSFWRKFLAILLTCGVCVVLVMASDAKLKGGQKQLKAKFRLADVSVNRWSAVEVVRDGGAEPKVVRLEVVDRRGTRSVEVIDDRSSPLKLSPGEAGWLIGPGEVLVCLADGTKVPLRFVATVDINFSDWGHGTAEDPLQNGLNDPTSTRGVAQHSMTDQALVLRTVPPTKTDPSYWRVGDFPDLIENIRVGVLVRFEVLGEGIALQLTLPGEWSLQLGDGAPDEATLKIGDNFVATDGTMAGRNRTPRCVFKLDPPLMGTEAIWVFVEWHGRTLSAWTGQGLARRSLLTVTLKGVPKFGRNTRLFPRNYSGTVYLLRLVVSTAGDPTVY